MAATSTRSTGVFVSERSDIHLIMSLGNRRALRLTESSSSLLGRVDFHSLGPDPLSEMQIFAVAHDADELDQRLDEQIRHEVAAMLTDGTIQLIDHQNDALMAMVAFSNDLDQLALCRSTSLLRAS